MYTVHYTAKNSIISPNFLVWKLGEITLLFAALPNSFLILFITFSQISLYFSNKSSSFVKKDIYLVSSKSLIYALNFRTNIHKGQVF